MWFGDKLKSFGLTSKGSFADDKFFIVFGEFSLSYVVAMNIVDNLSACDHLSLYKSLNKFFKFTSVVWVTKANKGDHGVYVLYKK